MTILVGDKCEEVVLMHAFVDAQVLTHVFRKQYPVAGMICLFPITETAEVLLVVLLQRVAVCLKVSLQRAGRYWVCIQIFFLRHPQTPWSSGCLLRSALHGEG